MGRSSARKDYFTKHLFRAGLQCPTKLYYYAKNYSQDQHIRPFLEHAGYNKSQLKGVLRSSYPDGMRIKERNYAAAHKKTHSQLERVSILFDAVFIHVRKVAKVPVLIVDSGHVQLLFVQTKIINPNKHRLENHHGKLYKKWGSYIYDAAFQTSVIKQLHPDWKIKCLLVLPDKTAKANQSKLYEYLKLENLAILNEDLFCRIDITRYIQELLDGKRSLPNTGDESFEKTVERLAERYFSRQKATVNIGLKCRNCEFRIQQESIKEGKKSGFNECWTQSEAAPEYTGREPHVFDLIGPGVRRWVNEGIYLQKNIPPADLPDIENIVTSAKVISQKERQALQVKQAKRQEVPREIIKPDIFTEIKNWQYPLHFLDFEAGNYAVPTRKGRRPYHLLVFQFSCHTLCEDGSLHHTDWISKNGTPYPNYELVRQLMEIPSIAEGTIIQYSNFERTALKIIRKELLNETNEIAERSELITWLDTVIQRHDSNHSKGPYLADLSRLVKNFYYNRYMADSLSIKDVVQSVLTLSETLSNKYQNEYEGSNFKGMKWWQWEEENQQAKNPYLLLKNLQPDVKVGRGTEAMVTYGKLLEGSLRGVTKKKALKALLQYCELDTLAMVMIYQHWQGLVENK